jgi:hypothetical protein
MMGNQSSYTAAWTSSPLDECLDKLGTCESTVSECETANHILEAQMLLLRHPNVIIGLACFVAVALLLGLLRCCWHLKAGAVPGAFPLDLCPGWVLRRLWRGLRWPFVQGGARLFGREAAEGVAGVMDELAVSPQDVESATIRRHQPSVPTFRGVPAGAVYGVQRDVSLTRTAPGSAPPPPPPPPSAATVFHSALSKQVAPVAVSSFRSCADRLPTPARKCLDFGPSELSRHTTVIDVSTFTLVNFHL